MQSKWSFPTWLSGFWPSSSYSDPQRNNRSTNNLNFRIQCGQFLKLAQLSILNTALQPTSKKSFGDAWTGAVQYATLLFPYSDKTTNPQWNTKVLVKMQSCMSATTSGSTDTQFLIAYTHMLSLLFDRFSKSWSQLCFPTFLALNGAIMPPLENMPKLFPSEVEEDETNDKRIFFDQQVAMTDISSPPVCINNSMLKEIQKEIVEPKTGFKFPVILFSDSAQDQTCSNMQVLAGIGLKKVTVVKVKSLKIYAFGFYIIPEIVKSRLGHKYAKVPPEELKHHSSFYEDLLRYSSEMTVRLIVHYKGLKMGMVRSAFENSLKNRLKKIKGVETDDGLNTFNSYFSEDLSLPQGTVIDFKQLPGGVLRTEINGKPIGSIHSNDFCRAFFDIYIGDPPVSQKAKEDIGERLGQILRMG